MSEPIEPIVEFDGNTRAELLAAYRNAFVKEHPEHSDPDFEASCFVGGLEKLVEIARFAESRGLYRREAQQRRREKIEAFANCLDRCIDTSMDMDDHSLGYAVWQGLQEMVKDSSTLFDPDELPITAGLPAETMTVIRVPSENLDMYRVQLVVYQVQKQRRDMLAKFALGVRNASKTLPEIEAHHFSFEEQVARHLEDDLGRHGIALTTSDTGLAGRAFLATMALAGREVNSAKYWLGKAQKNPGSFRNWLRNLRARLWH